MKLKLGIKKQKTGLQINETASKTGDQQKTIQHTVFTKFIQIKNYIQAK